MSLQNKNIIPPLYHCASFILSAAELKQLPNDAGFEIAFAGRSNAGKSTALNVLTGQKQLAKTSKQPGRTQLINLFELDDERRLVDLPGYGYAKVPKETKQRWQATLAKYLETRACLRGMILLMDIRHPLKEYDQHMLEWALEAQLPVHVLLTKADKLKRGAAMSSLREVNKYIKALSEGSDLVSVQLFSGLTREGREQVYEVMNGWLHVEN